MKVKSMLACNCISSWIRWGITTAIIVVFQGVLIWNTMPKESKTLLSLEKRTKKCLDQTTEHHVSTTLQKTTQELPACHPFSCNQSGKTITLKSSTETTKTDDGVKLRTITQDELDTVLQTIAYASRQEAVNEYRNNFSVLLTILAVFGIAWPVIMTFIQSQRFNQDKKTIQKIMAQYRIQVKKLDSIYNEVQDQTRSVYFEIADIVHANEWFWNFEIKKYSDLIDTKTTEIKNANAENKESLSKEKAKLEKSRDALTKNRAKTLMKMIYYNALAGKNSRANSKVYTLLDLLKKIQGWIDVGTTSRARTVKEINWKLFRQKDVLNAKEIEERFKKIFSLSWEEDSEEEDYEND